MRETIQGRDTGILHQGAYGGSSEKRLASEYNLKVGQAVPNDGLDTLQKNRSQG